MTTGIKLAIGGVIISAVTGYMAYLGAASSWQYYLTVDECLADGDQLGNSRLRVHGTVPAGTLYVVDDRSQATFQLAGESGQIAVTCRGPLPDNLAEEMEVVVEGRLTEAGFLRGERVLTKCASKYESQNSLSEGYTRQAEADSGGRW